MCGKKAKVICEREKKKKTVQGGKEEKKKNNGDRSNREGWGG